MTDVYRQTDNRVAVTQGKTFVLQVNVKATDGTTRALAGYSARMQGRDAYTSATTLFDLTSSSEISLANSSPNITITIAASATASLVAPNSGVYDLEIVNGSVVEEILRGPLIVVPEVTR